MMCMPPRRIIRVLVAALIAFGSAVSSASAQDATRPAAASDIPSKVFRDPTTLAPMLISFELRQLDWKSSQVFFQHGWLEHNGDFTVNGLPDGNPIGYQAGRRKNVELALVELPIALVHNTAERSLEARLCDRYPSHRTLWRTLGWIERVSFASYRASRVATHYEQWQHNEQLARQLGYR
jgi:hypothetical protein